MKIESKTGKMFKVTVKEYERGYGQRILETTIYDNEAEAKKACEEVNKHNTSPTAPDCYIQADYQKV